MKLPKLKVYFSLVFFLIAIFLNNYYKITENLVVEHIEVLDGILSRTGPSHKW